MRWCIVILASLSLFISLCNARNYRAGEIVHASWIIAAPTSTWVEFHIPHCPRFGEAGNVVDFHVSKHHYNENSRFAFGFENHKFITPYIVMAENGNYLTRIDIHLVRDGKELVGLRWNTIYTPGIMLGKGEDPIEDDAFDDDWERLFPRDEEEEEGGGGGEQPDRGAELEHEGEGTNDNEAPEMPGEAPQEAEGEAVAEGEDGLVKIHYHWESLPSDDAERGTAIVQAIMIVALLAHTLYLIYNSASKTSASAATSSPSQQQQQQSPSMTPSAGIGFAPSSPLPPSMTPINDKEGKAA